MDEQDRWEQGLRERRQAEREAREEQERLTAAYEVRLQPLLRETSRRAQEVYLSGDGRDPYGALQDALYRAIRQVERLKTHEHQWNDDDRCDLCGADGRA
jgi:hypothetical protein